jgi:hypothetical protein
VGQNFWILKPTNLNWGRGIHIFNSLEQLRALIQENFKWPDIPDVKDKAQIRPASSMMIVQKYVERPLLIYKRKFDIRVWVLVSSTGKCYFFKEGYLRTSGSEFSLDPENPDDQLVHLTNNAIQKYSKTYGEYEDGNQMSFRDFQNYIDEHYADKNYNFFRDGLPKMKEYIVHSLLAVRKKLNKNNRKYWFELYGYDFIMDEEFNMWLIEVNTNPCLEESSRMLKHYLRRMVNDLINIEIDPKFPRPKGPKRYGTDGKGKADLGKSRTEQKRQQSASMVHKRHIKRKLSFSREVRLDNH